MGSDEDGGSATGRTFYPGVASIEQAQPITMERGQSIAGLDFQMLETTLTKVSGFVLTAKGTPAQGGHVSVRTASASKGRLWRIGGCPIAAARASIRTATFELMLQPGEYIIEGMAAQGDRSARRHGRLARWIAVRCVCRSRGESMSGVTIATGGGGTASGRFVFNGRGAPPAELRGFNVSFSGPERMMGDQCRTFNNRPTVNPDGTFPAENIWGTCQIRGGGTAKGWTFEAVMHNGNDITNRADRVRRRAIDQRRRDRLLRPRRRNRPSTVADERGTPTQDYVAIAFPVEKEKWGDQRFLRAQVMSPAPPPGRDPSGRLPTGRARRHVEQHGPGRRRSPCSACDVGRPEQSCATLLAGDYFVVALEDAAFEDLRDPEYLERLSRSPRASRERWRRRSVQLRRVKAPE